MKITGWKLGLIFCNYKLEQYYCSTKRLGGYLDEKQKEVKRPYLGEITQMKKK